MKSNKKEKQVFTEGIEKGKKESKETTKNGQASGRRLISRRIHWDGSPVKKLKGIVELINSFVKEKNGKDTEDLY